MAANRRLLLFVLAVAVAPLQQAKAQAGHLQGAWLEEGWSCASVFVATLNGVAFKRPANAFAPAFIVSGKDSVRQRGVISGVEPGRHDQAAFGVI